MRVHIERVNGQVVSSEIERFKDFRQCEVFAVSVNDDLLLSCQLCGHCLVKSGERTHVGRLFQLGLDESQQMLLVHACRVVDVRIDLSDVVKVTASVSCRPCIHTHATAGLQS
jgi:hypothetical protein